MRAAWWRSQLRPLVRVDHILVIEPERKDVALFVYDSWNGADLSHDHAEQTLVRVRVMPVEDAHRYGSCFSREIRVATR